MNTTKSFKIIDDLTNGPLFDRENIQLLLQDLHSENYTGHSENYTGPLSEYLFAAARFVREPHYGHKVFLRGLIIVSRTLVILIMS